MITGNSISKSFGAHVVLENASFTLDGNERIALVGKNGSGKTTLLSMLRGSLAPDNGVIHRGSEVIGFVVQELDASSTPEVERFEQWRLLYALERVNLKPDVLKTPVNDLSGGQRTRLSIAFVLAQDPEPTVLLLDEPTNNLDEEGMRWLKDFIHSFKGAVVLVSHDRSFINEVATKLWILNNSTLQEFKGNYDEYKRYEHAEHTRMAKEYEAHRQEQIKVEKLIRDAMERSKKGMRDQHKRDNDKMIRNFKNEYVQNSLGKRTGALQTRLEKLGTVDAPHVEKQYKVTLHGEVNSTKKVIEFVHIEKKYHDHFVLHDFNLTVRGVDRVHIKGKNGIGKSTLLKIGAGVLRPDGGTLEYGNDVRIGYLSQEVYGIDLSASGYETLSRLHVETEQIFKSAKGMGLSPELLKQKIADLSRGQQAKIGFLKLLLDKYDLLILDEPTNHLDISTRESIEQALQNYNGALLVASHDEYFVDHIKLTRTVNLE